MPTIRTKRTMLTATDTAGHPATSRGRRNEATPGRAAARRAATAAEAAQVDALLATMTLEEKVGQVMVVGFEGTTLSDEIRRVVADLHIGGIVYFAGNVAGPGQLAALSAELQKAAAAAGAPRLIICIDQEGGAVARLREKQGFTEFPSAMAIGATGDAANARRIGQAMAEELAGLGINMDLAPDLDVNNNPANPIIGTRSFGSDPVHVGEFGVAFMRGLQDGGIAAVGKHFPGHGDTAVDSHRALPVIPHDRGRLDAVEFVPFRAAMAAGIAGIMSAHITFPAVDPTPGLPGTLSPRVMTSLLRGEMGYNGLLLTDALEMGALPSSGFAPPAAAAAALAAGADILLMSYLRDESGAGQNAPTQAYQRVLDDVRSGKTPRARLEEAARRVLFLKARFGILAGGAADPAAVDRHVGTPPHRDLSRAIASQAVTVLRDDARLLPLPAGGRGLVVETPTAAGLGRLIGLPATAIGGNPAEAEIEAVVAQAQGQWPVIVTTANAAANPGQARLVQALLAAALPVIVAAVAGPYDLLQFPEAPTYLVTYGSAPPLLEALANALRGKAAAAGRLPVELPGLYGIGAGAGLP